jgi:hypothetical protein
MEKSPLYGQKTQPPDIIPMVKLGELPENTVLCHIHALIKKKNIFLIYKEIQKGAVAKSYMRKGFLIPNI